MQKIAFILLILITPFLAKAQDYLQQKQLADQHYQNKEFDRALPIYERILKKSNYDRFIYTSYLNVLIELEEFSKAEKELKKLGKSFPEDPKYKIDLGYIYTLTESKRKAEELFTEVLDLITPDERKVLETANYFRKIKQYKYAINAYLIGKKKLRNPILFQDELAELYLLIDQKLEYIQNRIDKVDYQPNAYENIQAEIASNISEKDIYKELKSRLLKRIQKRTGAQELTEFLIWTQVYLKEFEGAFIQTKALDKRLESGGKYSFQLAETMQSQKEYKQAIKIYNYLINGGITYYKIPAKSNILTCKKQNIESADTINIIEVKELINDYEQFLNGNNNHERAINTHKELAGLYAYYLFDFNKAKEILENALIKLRLSQIKKAEFKLELADILLFSGDIWEAMLVYGQVDKDFKDSPIGDKAKFKVAMLSYYTGDFDWAQTQLDVLKASTTKVISNDALHLSTFITDNYGLDSIHRPMYLYAQAELYQHQNKIDSCFMKLDSIIMSYPEHILTDDILYKKANLFIDQNKEDKAVKFLQKIIEYYSDDLLIDDAIYQLANIYEKQGKNLEAKDLYESIILKHSDSIFVTEARKKYRKLRGDNIN